MTARIFTQRFDLRTPYSIAYETISEAVNHFVLLEDADGRQGIGCAAPAPEVTGETTASSRSALEAFARAVNGGMPVEEALSTLPAANPSARAAADMAILDLRGVRDDRPVFAVLGGSPCSDEGEDPEWITRPISVTIGICPLDETVRLAGIHRDAGFSILKVKG
ncbi:MAG: hypothetical protein HKN17_03025, partial [Rhodothermales bacterium]|nr:hypothetical protein [Rhodothermales bacterium]